MNYTCILYAAQVLHHYSVKIFSSRWMFQAETGDTKKLFSFIGITESINSPGSFFGHWTKFIIRYYFIAGPTSFPCFEFWSCCFYQSMIGAFPSNIWMPGTWWQFFTYHSCDKRHCQALLQVNNWCTFSLTMKLFIQLPWIIYSSSVNNSIASLLYHFVLRLRAVL